MEANGFFASLFDYSFGSFITSKIIKLLYVLVTIAIVLGTLVLIGVAFKTSSTSGILTLLIFGPLYFLISMIFARVSLELVLVVFRIHENVREINQRGGGTGGTSDAAVLSAAGHDSAIAPPPLGSFCENCGAKRTPGKSFCTACGQALD